MLELWGPDVQRLHQEIVKVLRPDMAQKGIAGNGNAIVASSPGEFAKFIKIQYETWVSVIKASGINVN